MAGFVGGGITGAGRADEVTTGRAAAGLGIPGLKMTGWMCIGTGEGSATLAGAGIGGGARRGFAGAGATAGLSTGRGAAAVPGTFSGCEAGGLCAGGVAPGDVANADGVGPVGGPFSGLKPSLTLVGDAAAAVIGEVGSPAGRARSAPLAAGLPVDRRRRPEGGASSFGWLGHPRLHSIV